MSMNPKTYCPLPFTQISTENDGSYRLCCHSNATVKNDDGSTSYLQDTPVSEVWNNNFYKTIRSQMNNNERPSVCNGCYKLEDKGQVSYRERYNRQLPNNDNTMPTHLELKVGNLCNLKCVMCYPGASSLHQQEVAEFVADGIDPPNAFSQFETTDQFKKAKPQQYADNLNLDDCIRLTMSGGEPLVNKTTDLILDRCIEEDRCEQIELEVITNLTVLNPAMLNKIKKFPRSKLLVSWDHVYEKANYIRYPMDYKKFIDNLYQVQSANIDINVSSCITIFNVFDLKQIFDAWQLNGIKLVRLELVYFPLYFNIEYLTDTQLDLVRKQIELIEQTEYSFMSDDIRLKLESIKQLTSIHDDAVLAERKRVIDLYDKKRNTNCATLFPFIS